MLFGDVTKFRAKSCEQEENAWVQTADASPVLTVTIASDTNNCVILFRSLLD